MGAAAVAPRDPAGAVRVVHIPPGATVRQIARRLTQAGLLRSPTAFEVAARVRRLEDRLQSGEYALSPAMSTLEILDRLARGQVLLHPLTIPEGSTLVQIADLLAARGLGDRAAFLRVATEEGATFPHPFLPGRPNLEGYLFPDTYHLPRGLPARQVVARMLDRFGERVSPAWRARARDQGVSLHEAVIIASLVEREARFPDEQPVIAGVIYNRLRRGMRLEIDATVLYALGEHRPVVTERDLQVDSPYNTYRHAGLPPGPIANPGWGALRAALAPARVPYLFYVLRPDGRHAFSRTFQEHLANVRRYRR